MNLSVSADAGTFDHDDELPRIPLPTLDESARRLLDWCAPLLTPEELAETERELDKFCNPDGPGPKLQEALQKFDTTEGVYSWLDMFWPYRYLGRRDRIAINANFFFLFHHAGVGQADRAAGLIAGALHYKGLLDEERIPCIIRRSQPLSMDQNRYLFSTTRIPGRIQDAVRSPYSQEWPGPSDARHIVVFFRGAMFRMDVLGMGSKPHTLDEIVAAVTSILECGSEPGFSVGHLTTKARADWADARDRLTALHPDNAETIDTIETALFCLCLEDFAPTTTQDACDQLLHGNSANRWFDKSLSFIVFADGTAGINVEHCNLDGTTVLSFVDALHDQPAQKHSAHSGAVAQGPPRIEPMEFVLDADLNAIIDDAARSFADYACATATLTVEFDDFSATRAKQLKTSPDAFVQMAFQLAHKRAKGFLGATYESVATRHMRRGRTEAMRVVTPEAVRFVAAMDDAAAGLAEKRTAFSAAVEAHVQRAKDSQAGLAPEQHLWELQLIAERRGAELGLSEPTSLFETPGWLKMRDDYLSTSSAPSTNVAFFGFGSTSKHCIGVAYALLPDRFNVYLSTPGPAAPDMHAFARELRNALHELQTLPT